MHIFPQDSLFSILCLSDTKELLQAHLNTAINISH